MTTKTNINKDVVFIYPITSRLDSRNNTDAKVVLWKRFSSLHSEVNMMNLLSIIIDNNFVASGLSISKSGSAYTLKEGICFIHGHYIELKDTSLKISDSGTTYVYIHINICSETKSTTADGDRFSKLSTEKYVDTTMGVSETINSISVVYSDTPITADDTNILVKDLLLIGCIQSGTIKYVTGIESGVNRLETLTDADLNKRLNMQKFLMGNIFAQSEDGQNTYRMEEYLTHIVVDDGKYTTSGKKSVNGSFDTLATT